MKGRWWDSPLERKLRILSWALYDFANTIFSMNVISLHFALWVTVDKGGKDIHYSLALSSSMFVAALCVPILGVLSDQLQKRMPFLVFFTLICACATAGIGLTDSMVLGLLLFAFANFCYQGALVFYNSLLPLVSEGHSVGKVSGYGVSLGYLGAILGLKMVEPFVESNGRNAAFFPTAFFLSSSLCPVSSLSGKKMPLNLLILPHPPLVKGGRGGL